MSGPPEGTAAAAVLARYPVDIEPRPGGALYNAAVALSKAARLNRPVRFTLDGIVYLAREGMTVPQVLDGGL